MNAPKLASGRPDRARTAGEGMHLQPTLSYLCTLPQTSEQRVVGRGRAYGIGTGQSEGQAPGLWELRPYERSRCGEQEEKLLLRLGKSHAHPTGDGHNRTTDALAQCFSGANLRATLEVG